MPHDAESYLGVDPKPPGASPDAPESREARLVRLSLKAFVLGLAAGIPGLWWHFLVSLFGAVILIHVKFLPPELRDILELMFIAGLLAASAASLIVSLVWGLRVVRRRWYVLWWLIPAGVVLTLPCFGLLLFAYQFAGTVGAFVVSDFETWIKRIGGKEQWGLGAIALGGFGLFHVVRSMVRWILRREDRCHPPGKNLPQK